jgi:DNA-binding response OmpR family regulator
LSAEPVDLLVTDIVMPPPDGLHLIREALKRRQHLMAIVITGCSSKYSLEEVLEYGASDLILKPIRLSEFRARIAFAVERQRTLNAFRARQLDLQISLRDRRVLPMLRREVDRSG